MGLKTLHIIFITLSILLSFGFGLWCVSSEGEQLGSFHRVIGIASFVAAVSLLFYGIWFLRKLKNVGYM
jgi:hypothetical protein